MKFILSFLLIAASLTASSQMPRTLAHLVQTEDAKLFCEVVGKGKPLIVIHGGPGLSHDYLLPGMAELAKNHTLIFYDQRACGKSEGNPEEVNIDQYVQDLEALRQSLQYEKVSILGHSWGGFVAMKYALAHPEAVDRLILMNSMPDSSEGLGLFLQEWIKRMGPHLEALGAIEKSEGYKAGEPETVANHIKLIFQKYCAHEESADRLNLLNSKSANVHGAIVNAMFRENLLMKPYKLEIGSLKCKTLIVTSDHDVIPVAVAKSMHEQIQGSKFVIIKDCGHFPYVEKPQELFSTLNDFLGKDLKTE